MTHAFRLAHENATAPLTKQLLARDMLAFLLKKWLNEHGEDGKVGLVCFDIDYFKQVNIANGYTIADGILKEIAEKICFALEGSGGVCERRGGEEFVMGIPILPNVEFEERVNSLLESIRKIKRPNHTTPDPDKPTIKYNEHMSATISYSVIENSYFMGFGSFDEAYRKALDKLNDAVGKSKNEGVRDVAITVQFP
jgi:diguanylate cyclase (GGDEF)-like protein